MGRPVILALAVAVVLLAAGNAFSASQATPKLNGTVGPGFIYCKPHESTMHGDFAVK
jgi:hypothetical protein